MPAQGRKYLSISETAKFLSVSIDTIRRWDKNHTLNSIRLDGKNRYFDFEELTNLKSNKPLSISEAATRLGVSITTLRRLEVRGLLTPSRDANGERLYTKESLDHYLANRNFSRKEAQRDDLQDSSSIQSVSGMTAPISFTSPTSIEESILEEPGPSARIDTTLSEPIQPRETTNNFVKNVSENSEYSANQTQNGIPSNLPTQSESSELSEFSNASDSDESHSAHAAQYFTAPIMSFFKSEDLFFRAPRLHRPSFVPVFNQSPVFKLAFGATAALFLISIISFTVISSSKPETHARTVVPKMEIAGAQVLGSTTKRLQGNMKFNIPALFTQPVKFSENITVNGSSLFTENVTVQNKNLTLGSGTFTAGASTVTGLSTTGTLAVTGTSTLNGAVTLNNVLNMGDLASDPATGQNGAQYYNTTSNVFRCYVNGGWQNCDTTGGSMSSFNVQTNGSNSFTVANGNNLNFVAGSNISLTADTSNQKVTISATVPSSGMTSFTLAGDSGTSQTISNASILTVAGGSAISTVTSATGVVTANLDLFTGSGTTSTTSSASGLEVSSDALSLLRGCSDTQILKWNGTTKEWACGNSSGGVTGSGTVNTIPKFTTTTNIGDSLVTDDGTTFAINTNKFTVTEASGATTIADDLAVNGGDITTSASTFNLLNGTATTINLGGATTAFNIGSNSGSTITFGGAGTIKTTTTSALTVDSGTTGTVNIGTGNNAKTINVGTGNAGNTINIGTNNTVADTIAIGSALDTFSITSTGLTVSTAGALSGITGYTQSSGAFAFSGGGNYSVDSAAFDVTTAGAVSGVTTLNLSGAITGATATNTINGLIINSGALSAITGYSQLAGTFTLTPDGTNDVNITVANGSGRFLNIAGLASGSVANALCQDSSGNVITCTQSSGTVTGSGTTNTIPKFTSSTAIGDSLVTDDGTTFAINTNKFTVTEGSGNTVIAGTLNVTGAITAPTSTNTINGLVINSGALSAITGYTQSSGAFSATLTTTNAATFSSTTSGADSIAIKPQSSSTGAAFTATITSADLTVGDQTFTLPNLGAATSDTFCLVTLNNCFGGGGGSGVTYTAQTTNRLTKFTSTAGQITSSLVSDDGTTLSYTGSGGLVLGTASTTTGALTLYSSGNAFYTKFQNSASQTQDIIYTLPVDDGSNNYVLSTNGSGTLSWVSVSGAGGISGSGTSGQIAFFNGASSITSESSGFGWDTTNKLFTLTSTATTQSASTFTANSLTTGNGVLITSNSTAGDNSVLLNLTRSGTNGTSAKTNYGLKSAISNTGTSSTNIAGYFSASGGSNNYALIVPSGGGNVGIGTTAPGYKLDVSASTTATSGGSNFAQQTFLSATPGGASTANYIGIYGITNYNSASTNTSGGAVIGVRGEGYVSNARSEVVAGIDGFATSNSSDTSAFTSSLYGGRFQAQNSGTGRITHAIGVKVNTPTNNGTIDVAYGMYIANISGGTANSALHIEGSGSGNAITFAGDGSSALNAKIYSASANQLSIDATSNLLLTTGASNLVNVLTGNLKVGNGTPTQTLSGESAYVEGNIELDGQLYADGLTSGTPTGSVCYDSSNKLIQCSGGSSLTGSGTSGQIAFFNGTNSVTSESSGFGWDTTNKLFTLTSATTTGAAQTITASSISTGEALNIVGPTTTGVTSGASSGFVKIAADVGSGGTAGSLLYLAPDFSAGSATTGYGLNIAGTDATSTGNTNYLNYNSLALTGNAAKTGVGLFSQVTTSSTTADTLFGLEITGDATGVISSGTRTIRGIYSHPNSTSANSGGTLNIQGGYFTPTLTGATTGSTTNLTGLYVAPSGVLTTGGTLTSYGVRVGNNGTIDTTGTTTQYGISIDALSGADTNIDLNFVSTAPKIAIGDGGTLNFTDGSNTLLSLADAGSTGNLAVTGLLQVGSGTSFASYNRIGSGTATGANINNASDLLISDSLEVAGTTYLKSTINTPLTGSRFVTTDSSGNLAVSGSSANLASTLSDETGSGLAVFGTSPTITTSLVAGSASFDLLNTTATTINFAGAATALNIGAGSGTTTINNDLTISANKNLSLTSGTGTFTQTYTGTGSSTTFAITSNATAGGNVEPVNFNLTHAPASSADTYLGLDVELTQNPSVAGNTETGMRVYLAATSNTTDTTFNRLMYLYNADTPASGSTIVNDGLLIEAATDGFIIDAIDVSDPELTNALNVGANTITGAGYTMTSTGSGLTINSTSADLTLTTTTSGNITLTPSSASALVNVLTGNLKVGNGTPTQTLSGESAYIEGNIELDGQLYADGLGSGTPSGSVCYDSSNKLIQCSGGSSLTGSGTSGQIAFFNGTNSITSETSGFGWDTTNKLFTLTSTATTQTAAAFVGNSLTTGNLLSLSSTSTAGDGSTLLNLSRSGTNGASGKTNYGIQSAITNTGTSSTNIAGYFSASGATNNYGIIVPNGGGNVGIGTSAPAALLHISASTGTGTTAGIIIDSDTADNAYIDFYEENIQVANIFWHGTGNYLAVNSGNDDTIISSANGSLVGIGSTAPDMKLEINSLTGDNLRLTYADGNGGATDYADFTTTSAGDLGINASGNDINIAAGDNLNLVSGAGTFNQTFTGTTTDAFNMTAASLTTGELMNLNATYAPTDGSTNEAIDINLTHSPTTSADNFRGIDLAIADSTSLGNTVIGYRTELTLTGNAAKTGLGVNSVVTSSSTTADTMHGIYLHVAASGAISTGTRNQYGVYSVPQNTATNTGGTTNIYGTYNGPSYVASADVTGSTVNVYGDYISTTGTLNTAGTINQYGLYVANGTSSTTGTSTKYGVYIEPQSGADTNVGASLGGGTTANLWLNSDTASIAGGITFGTARDVSLYRSAADMLKTDDNLTIAGLTTGTPTGSVCYDSNNTLIQCSGGSSLTGSGTSGQIAFFNGTNSVTSESSGFGWDSTNDLFTITSGATTSDVMTLTASSLTTGSALYINGPTSTGITDSALKVTSDVGSGGYLAYLIPDYSGAGVTATGAMVAGTDNTSSANINYNVYSSLTATGNAAKSLTNYYAYLTSSSTTADSLIGYYANMGATGAISTGTRNIYGAILSPASSGAASGGTTNIYGLRSVPTSTNATTGSTTNLYGASFAPSGVLTTGGTLTSYGVSIANNSTIDTTGTTTQYGLHIAALSGADTNVGLYIADASTYSLQLASTDGDAASGITFGTDTNLYRSGASVLKTDDNLIIGGLTSGTPSGSVCYDSSNQLIQCSGGSSLTGSGTSGQIAFFNGTNSITSESSGFGWDTTNKLLTITASSSQSTQTTAAISGASNSYSTGGLLSLALSQSAATGTSVSGDIANFSFSPTYSTAVTTPTISGNVLDISRAATTNSSFASTLTVSGAVASITDNCTQTTGTCTNTANVLSLTQSYASSTGQVLKIANSGSGASILLPATNGTSGGLQFGTDANLVTLYRSANDTLKTDDKLIVGTLASAAANYLCYDGSNTLASCSGTPASAAGTSGQIAFFNGASSLISETSGFGWDTTNKLFTIVGSTGQTTQTTASITSAANGYTTGKLLNVDLTQSAATGTSVSGNIANINFSPAYTTNVSFPFITGSLLNLNRSISTSSSFASTLSVTGPIVNITNNCTQSTGTCTVSGDLLKLTENYTNSMGNLLEIVDNATHASGGYSFFIASSITSGTAQLLTASSLTSGTALQVSANSNSFSNGKVLYIELNQSAATGTSVSGNIAAINFAPTYSTAVTTPAISGNVLNIARSATTNSSFSSTLTLSGAVASISSNCTQTTGTCTDTSNVLSLTQSYASNTGAVLSITNNSATANKGIDINMNAITTGTALNISSTSTGLAAGSLLKVSSGSTTNVSGGIVNFTATADFSGNTSTGGLLGLFANSTTGGIVENIRADALVGGQALRITSTNTGLTTGSLIYAETATTGALATTGAINFTATGAYTSSSNVSFFNVIANSTTAGNIQRITGNALTTGNALVISSTSTGLTSGSLLNISSSTTGAVATTGIVSLTASGAYTTSSSGGLLNLYADSTTAGTVQNISADALTTGIGLNIDSTSTGLTTGSILRATSATTGAIATNGAVNFVASGAFTSTSNMGFVNIAANSTAAGTIQSISGNALTTGQGLYISSTSNGYTTGNLLALSLTQSAATGTSVSGNVASVTFNPTYSTAITSPAISGNLLNLSRAITTNGSFASTLTISGAVADISNNCTQTTGTCTVSGDVLKLTQSYAASTGNSLNIADSATHASGGSSLLVTGNSVVSGTIASIVGNGVTTGKGLSIASTGTGLTSGSLLYVSSATTGAVATNGAISLNASGNFTSTSNMGFVNVAANSTTAGTIHSISGNALTTGQALYISSSSTGMTSGSLLYATSATTGAVATNGLISLNASGNYTSTSNAGLLTVIANSTTAGTIQKISGSALTTGTGLYLTTAALTTGNALDVEFGTVLTTGNGILASGTTTATTTPGTGIKGALTVTPSGATSATYNAILGTTTATGNTDLTGKVLGIYGQATTNVGVVTTASLIAGVAGSVTNTQGIVTKGAGLYAAANSGSIQSSYGLYVESQTNTVTSGTYGAYVNPPIVTGVGGTVTNAIGIDVPSATVSHDNNTTTITNGFGLYVGATTYTSSGSLTVTNPVSVYIAGPPVASTNTTFTNAATALAVASGNVGIGNTAPSYKLQVDGTLKADLSSSTTGDVVCWNTTTHELIHGGGGCSNSSRRYKHDITSLDANSSLAEILQMRPVSFVYNTDYNATDQSTHVGFIAEEIHDLDPRLVVFEPDGVTPKGVQYENITALLAGAVQVQAQQITALQQNQNNFTNFNLQDITAITVTADQVNSDSGSITHLASNIIDTASQTVTNTLQAGEVVSNTIFNKSKDIKADLSNGLTIYSLSSSRGLTSQGNAEVRPLFSVNPNGEASASAKLSAPHITADQAEIETLTVKNLIVENLIQNGATGSATIDFANQGIKADFAELDNLTVNTDLSVAGTATLADVAVMNQMKFNNNLTIDETSINTLGSELEIQPLKQEPISLMANAVRIETDGTVTFNENVAFKKDVAVAGVLSAQTIKGSLDDVKVASSAAAVVISDTEVQASGSAGLVTLKAGETQVKIDNPKVTADSLIFVTPKGATGGKDLYIKNQTPGASFTVGVDGTAPLSDITFNFLIVN